jgi:hypothetical protein
MAFGLASLHRPGGPFLISMGLGLVNSGRERPDLKAASPPDRLIHQIDYYASSWMVRHFSVAKTRIRILGPNSDKCLSSFY